MNLSDQKEASLVCKRWYEASLDPILQKDMVITLHSLEEWNGLTRRQASHLQVNHSNLSALLEPGQTVSHNLKSLSLRGTVLTEKNFVNIMLQCHSLVTLNLSGCNSLFMTGNLLEMNSELVAAQQVLVNLKELNLSSIRYMSDVTFNRIVTICPNVEKVSLASCPVMFYAENYHIKDTSRFASNSLLTFKNVEKFIQIQSKLLKSLNFSRTTINNAAIKSIAKTENLQLRELILVGCKEINDDSIVILCEKQNKLKFLNLSLCPEIGNRTMHAINENLAEIQELSVSKCRYISDQSVSALQQSPSLVMLDFSSCEQISSPALIKGICHSSMCHLLHVDLSFCGYLKDELVVALCENVKQLRHLDVASCFPLTDKSVHAISRNLKYLHFLRLAWCKLITDFGLLGMNAENHDAHHHHEKFDGECKCTRKYHSNIFNKPTKKNTKPVTVDIEYEDDGKSIQNLGGLRHLDMSACPSLTDLSITNVVKYQELQLLNLSMCTLITDASITAIITNVPCLEQLYIAYCKHISDKSVHMMAQKLKRLTHLDVSNIDQITNRSMEALCMYATRLRYLDVSLCSGLSIEAVEQVELCLKHLNSVQKRWVGQMK